ncbi:MAG: PTS fructose transporter subunit IIB [Cellulosilyticaceae bacterium]
MKDKIVAICSCPTGIAQTYMGAEALKEVAKRKNIAMKVETRGAFGIENPLTQQDIEEATYILLASYVEADVTTLGAFKGKKIYQVDIHQVVRNVEQVLDDLIVNATII